MNILPPLKSLRNGLPEPLHCGQWENYFKLATSSGPDILVIVKIAAQRSAATLLLHSTSHVQQLLFRLLLDMGSELFQNSIVLQLLLGSYL